MNENTLEEIKKRKRLLILYTASIGLNWTIFSGKMTGTCIIVFKNDYNFDSVTLSLRIYPQKIIVVN